MNVPQDYFKAGRIASRVCKEMVKKVSKGNKVLEICNNVENMIKRLGGDPAFPCNVCINNVAAHYTAETDDESVIHDGDVVKIDVGVHVNGYIADTAFTISFNPDYDELVMATKDVLYEAISMIRGGVKVGDIGRVIENGARKRGFQPISNLSGHLLKQYCIHGGISIPNVWVANTPSLRAYEVYAIEPFLTTLDGTGMVKDDRRKIIYSLIGRKKIGDKNLDFLAEEIWRRFKTLPFANRWLTDVIEKDKIKKMITKLVENKILRAYPVLLEASGRYVAQFEKTVVPTESGAMITTDY